MKSLGILVPVVGLCYFALFASLLIVRGVVSPGGLALYQLFFIPLATACALSAVGIWYKPMVGYVGAIAISIILILIFFLTKDGNDVITVLSSTPSRNPVQFFFYLTAVPTFFTNIASSAIGIALAARGRGSKE